MSTDSVYSVQSVHGRSDKLVNVDLVEELVALSRLPVAGRTVKVQECINKLISIDSPQTSPISTLTDVCSGQLPKLPTEKGLQSQTLQSFTPCMYSRAHYNISKMQGHFVRSKTKMTEPTH